MSTSQSKAENTKRALAVVLWGKAPAELEKRIRSIAVNLGITVTLSQSVQETVELAQFSPRLLVFGVSADKNELVHCVSISKLLRGRIQNSSVRLILLYGHEIGSITESLKKFEFHSLIPISPMPSADEIGRTISDSQTTLQVSPEFLSDRPSTQAKKIPSEIESNTIEAEVPAPIRVRNTPPTQHIADFWIRPKTRGQEPRKIGNRWKISLKGPSPIVGGWFHTPAPAACAQAPHDQEPGWWEWKFREGLIPASVNDFDPREFEQGNFRWIAHGAEPWAENELWHFSGSFPLLILLERVGKEEKIAAIRFIARHSSTLDLAYDCSNAHYIGSKMDATWESLTKDILEVRTIDPSQFQTRTFKKPDAASLLSQLTVPSPDRPPTERKDPIPELEGGPIGPARFFEKHGGFDEFELRWLYTEWLLNAGGQIGKKRSDDITEITLKGLAFKWFEFATELVQSVSPQAELELWQEIEPGLDLLEEVQFFEDPGKQKPSKPPQMAFSGLSVLPGVRGFSKRARWGASQTDRPLGVALLVRQNDQRTLAAEVTSTLERVTEFIAQTLPASPSSRRVLSPRKAG